MCVPYEPLPLPEEPRSNQTFVGFERLPAELRIVIAEYVMSASEPLKWTYTSYTATKKVGTFHGLDRLTALRRVSKQCYKDTVGLEWKYNEFEFEELRLGVAYEVAPMQIRHGDSVATISAALELFYENAPIKAVRAVKTITYKLHFQEEEDAPAYMFAPDTRARLERVLQRTPWLQVRIIDDSWTLNRFLTVDRFLGKDPLVADVRERIDIFLAMGREYEECLEAEGLTSVARNWRVYPALGKRDVRRLRRYLTEDLLSKVENWTLNGV